MTELPKLMQVFSGALQYGFGMDAILAQVAATQAHDTVDRLGQIKAPTLVLTGDTDMLIPSANSDVLAASIPGARLREDPRRQPRLQLRDAGCLQRRRARVPGELPQLIDPQDTKTIQPHHAPPQSTRRPWCSLGPG